MIDRQARDLPLDAHLHTDLSPDSDVPIDVFAEQAVARGITELAITDHVDFEPSAPAYRYTTFEQRERSVREAAERWADRGLMIRFGAELTYDHAWEADIRDHLRRHAYDFTIGSWHDRTDSPFSEARVAGWVAGRSLAQVVAPAFEQVVAAARSGLFDTLGHIDMVKRFIYPYRTPSDLAAAPELYEPVLRALIDSGTALEINASGLRHAVRESYPSPAIVAMFQEMGGRAITIGSDAHRATQFGWGLADGYDAAAAAGFSSLRFRRGGDPVTVPMTHTPNAVAGRSL